MRAALILAVFALAGACGGSEHPTANAAAGSSSADAVVAPPPPKDTAYKLVIATSSCLLGGLWSEVDGETGGSERRAATAKRCVAVVHAVTGEDDPMKVESLRMLDASITDPLVAKVKELAQKDNAASAADLAQLAGAIVSAAREAASARRAAAKLHADIERLRSDKEKTAARDRDADRLSADEANVVPALRSGAGLDALVHFAGVYSAEAHAIGILLALSRVRAAQDLPKHMKLYTVAPAYSAVFGVQPPPLPDRAKDRLKPGTWLAYVLQVASACGHPVPPTVTKPKEKEPLAWTGILSGFADRLQADQPRIKDEALAEVVKFAVERLEQH